MNETKKIYILDTSAILTLTSHVTEDEINLLDYWRVLVKRKLPATPPDIRIHSKHIPAPAGGRHVSGIASQLPGGLSALAD